MNEFVTHTVTITVTGNYTLGVKQNATVTISGDGKLDHMLGAFRTALVAAGFGADVAMKLDCPR